MKKVKKKTHKKQIAWHTRLKPLHYIVAALLILGIGGFFVAQSRQAKVLPPTPISSEEKSEDSAVTAQAETAPVESTPQPAPTPQRPAAPKASTVEGLAVSSHLKLPLSPGWDKDFLNGHSYDLVVVGNKNYKLLISVLTGNEGSPDSCSGCPSKVIDSLKLLDKSFFLIQTTDVAYPEGRPSGGGIGYKYEDTRSIRLSSCADKFCPIQIPYTNERLHYVLIFTDDYGAVIDLDPSTQASKDAIAAMKKLTYVD